MHDTDFCDVQIVSTISSAIDLPPDHADSDGLHNRQSGQACDSGPETCSNLERRANASVGAVRDGRRANRTDSVIDRRPTRRRHRDERTSRIEPLDEHSAPRLPFAPSDFHHQNHAGARHDLGCPQARRPCPTTDSNLRPPAQPPVACRPSPTTPSSPSAHGRSRCAPRASARWRSRSRWRARGIRSG